MMILAMLLGLGVGAIIILSAVVCEMWGNIVKLRTQMSELITKYELTELMDLPQLVEHMKEHPLVPVWDENTGLTYKRK